MADVFPDRLQLSLKALRRQDDIGKRVLVDSDHQDEYPVRCYSTGGRQSRTGPEYGHIYDHFSSVYEYAGGIRLFSTTRHQRGCDSNYDTVVMGTDGDASLARRRPTITGKNPWGPPAEREPDSHQLHDAFFAALRSGKTINNGDYMAKSTMMAIIARMSAYTGKTLTWQQAMNSQERLAPDRYAWDADPPPANVAIPGVTPFVGRRWRRVSLPKSENTVNCVEFSPDGQRIVSASNDLSVRIWAVPDSDQRRVRVLLGHKAPPVAVCFSHDGRRLASADESGVVLLWDVITGQQLVELSEASGTNVLDLTFRSDKTLVAITSKEPVETYLYTWNAAP